ncbi:MAG: iron-sulfur cluster insertion protein ErpA [Chloroflexi bacterium]|nr:iron-sulfur cluster insertion protein ErpA [Chloroflexota bacterium]
MDLLEQTQTAHIDLTPAAAVAVQELLAKRDLGDLALRVFVSGGGCSGFQYGMALEDNIRETDIVSEQHGVKLVIDEISINYLDGAKIDYVDEVMGSGFKVENPNAVSTCGCGSSFRTSDDQAAADTAGGCSC